MISHRDAYHAQVRSFSHEFSAEPEAKRNLFEFFHDLFNLRRSSHRKEKKKSSCSGARAALDALRDILAWNEVDVQAGSL